jgi:hypothetical protein
MKDNKKTLVIIAGAAGEIGIEFSKALVEKGINTLGVIRNKRVEGVESDLFETVTCELSSSANIEAVFSRIDLANYSDVIYLHTIGADKFNPRGYPDIQPMTTIDEDIYNTNVNSFKYLLRYLVSRNSTDKFNLKVAIIAGVSDKYTPFVIEPFCEAKFILREYIRSYVDRFPEWFSGLSINITSTITRSALSVRPKANTKDWLEPKEVVEHSIDELLADVKGYKEKDVIKYSESFVDGYYENNELLYDKWSKETGIS